MTLNKVLKLLSQFMVAGLVYVVYGCMRILPVAAASWVMGWMVSLIGPWTFWHKRATHNIVLAMPELDDAARSRILKGMWWNLGRTIGEYPHTATLANSDRVTFEGIEDLAETQETGGFLISAHFSNWEINSCSAICEKERFVGVFRPFNNPFLNLLLNSRRKLFGKIVAKGFEAAQAIIQTPRRKYFLGMLVDQKLNEGMAVKFFGRLAMTPVSYIKVAQRHDIPIIASHNRRISGCRFKIAFTKIDVATIRPDLARNSTERQLAIAEAINEMIEGWIRADPELWLWIHRRWPETDSPEINGEESLEHSE